MTQPDVDSSTLTYGEFRIEIPKRLNSGDCEHILYMLPLIVWQMERRLKKELAAEACYDPIAMGA